MDLELDEILQWQTTFCTLDQIDLPELYDDLILDTPDVDAIETNLSSSTITSSTGEPVSSPLWPCDLQTSALCEDGILALPSVQLSAPQLLDPVGSPQSSTVPLTRASQEPRKEAPVIPPVKKPKRTRATRRAAKSTSKAKKQCPESAAVVAECSKENEIRLPTQAEHIIRERQRRDDMSAKYVILESLLPPAPKRERAVVVESAMLFVKDLQQKRSALLKRCAKLKLMAPKQFPTQQLQRKKTMSPHNSSGFVIVSGDKKLPEKCTTDSLISSSQQELATSPGTLDPASTAVEGASSGSVQQLHVHVHFSGEEIVIDMVCHQPRQNFQSFLLQAVESFGMEVVRCSIHRVPHGFVQSTITCIKSQAMNASSEVQMSSSLIGALKNVLTRS